MMVNFALVVIPAKVLLVWRRIANRRPSDPGEKSALVVSHPLCQILNYMVQYKVDCLSVSFAALSDATRRGVLEQLGIAESSISELAEKFGMTLTGMKKHVSVLEQAGLVATEKVGRVRTCRLGRLRMREEAAWIERYRKRWEERFDALDGIVAELKREERASESDA